MKATKAAGTRREHQVKAQLEKEGWVVVRSPASGSPVDLWALKRGEESSALKVQRVLNAKFGLGNGRPSCGTMALQIKANTGSPWMNFRKAEREELLALSARAGATPWLVHWPPRGECRWLGASEWPK